jgi:hypothetical protein
MRPDLEKRLGETHPELLRHLHSDPERFPIGRGIEADSGWFCLIDRLCHRLTGELVTNPDPGFCLVQVKQKFGVMRVYTTATANPRVTELIADSVEESKTTCEPCGASGGRVVTQKGSVRVLCPTCLVTSAAPKPPRKTEGA